MIASGYSRRWRRRISSFRNGVYGKLAAEAILDPTSISKLGNSDLQGKEGMQMTGSAKDNQKRR